MLRTIKGVFILFFLFCILFFFLMRIGGVLTGQNVSSAALRRPGVYCVCGKGLRDTRSGVRGPGSGVGAVPAPAAGRVGASVPGWLLAPSNAPGNCRERLIPWRFHLPRVDKRPKWD